MCGICGEIAFGRPAKVENIAAMLGPLEERGPDSSGVYSQGSIAIGHRRLSILDLSASAQQPMIDPELGLAIAFNGCIYNFRDLRRELEQKGYQFFSDGDTEVILKAYHAWGARCVERFIGMFAFAIVERDSGKMVLARDRLGIKPLYYAVNDERLVFSSTLPSLLATGGIDTEIDPAALHHYMSFHAVVPAPLTILKGVKKLPPATLMTVSPDGTRHEEQYWSMSVGPRREDRALTEADWKEAVRESLMLAIRRRMIADVPVGVLLSGGLDSSLIVGLLAEAGQTNLETFAIGFDSVGGLAGDEFKYSDLVAREFGARHHQIRIEPQRSLAALPAAIAGMSEPMMSHDSVGFYLLSEEVSKHVKVVQSGQGADEIFGGYHWHQAMLGSNDPVADYARLYFDRTHDEMREAIAPRFMNGDYSMDFVTRFFAQHDAASAVDKTLQIDSDIMLVDDPVKRVDNMTMAFGLEARVPFLDHELVELAARVPANLKVRNGGKYIVKEMARSVLPAAVIDRPKGYFPVPALKYIRGPFLDFVRDILNDPRARQRALFNDDYVDRLLSDPERALTPKGHSKLWQVALLESWLQTHNL